jgi:hypothetical protein
MTDAQENAQLRIGKTATLESDGWHVTVVVIASRVCYGRTDYNVAQPQRPHSARWVSHTRLYWD